MDAPEEGREEEAFLWLRLSSQPLRSVFFSVFSSLSALREALQKCTYGWGGPLSPPSLLSPPAGSSWDGLSTETLCGSF